jgi:hypothetical protein
MTADSDDVFATVFEAQDTPDLQGGRMDRRE